MSDPAFIIIDVQNDFSPGGALAVAEGDQIVPLINELQSRFSIRVLTQDWHPANHSSFADSHEGAEQYSVIQAPYGPQVLWPSHCVQGSKGAEFHRDLRIDADMIIRKGFRPEIDSYSAFFENDHKTPTGLAGYLRERGVESVVLAGLATDYCVSYSAIDARKLGFDVTVVEDACRAIDLDGSLAFAIRDMDDCGVKRLTSAEL